MEVIYIDRLFIINLIIDYLILLSSGRVCGCVLRRWRYLAASVFGAVFAALTIIPGFGILSLPASKLGCGALMAVISFSSEKKPVKCALVFFCVSAAFGGAVWATSLLTDTGIESRIYIPVSFRVLAVSFALCYAAVTIVFRRSLQKSEKRTVNVCTQFSGRTSVFRALVDTGNCLYDPMTGRKVIVISADTALTILPSECSDALHETDPIDMMQELSAHKNLKGKIRLIPYSTVDSAGGLLPVFRPDVLTIDGKPDNDVMIAVAASLKDNGEYEAIY